MTQVSRFPLPKHLEKQMHRAIRKAFADLRTEDEVEAFLDDLLSPTEKIMLAKRLAIAILLDQGYDQRTIHEVMKTSVTTVNTVNYWLKNNGNGYRNILAKFKAQKEWHEVKEGIADVLKTFFSANRQFRKMHGLEYPKEVTPRDDLL